MVALSVITDLSPPRAAGLEDVAAMKNFSFDFQSILLPHFLAPEMCYTEDVVKILDHVNNHLRQISTYKIGKSSLDGIKCLRVFEGCEICLKFSDDVCSVLFPQGNE